MRQLIINGLLAALITLPLVGCLVGDSDEPDIINRNMDSVRFIVNGDYYEYKVTGTITNISGSSQTVTGTLRVDYYTDTINQPFGSPTLISVIREETRLTLGGSLFPTTRYIQQDVNGSLWVLAANSGGTLFRTGPENGGNSELTNIEFLRSPVPLTGNTDVNFQYLYDCESGLSCVPGVVTIFDEAVTYSGNADITTNSGRFNALRYDFSGSVITTFNALFDFRTACSTTSSVYEGSTFVFPEVGIVFYDYTCTASDGSGTGHNFRASLSQTNVPIPSP